MDGAWRTTESREKPEVKRPIGVGSPLMTSSREWQSTAEAAKALGITPRTLYRFINEGQLPAYRFGRVIRLKTAEVDAFVETCRIEPGTLEHLYPETVADA